MLTSSSIDAYDPQTPELPLSLAAISIGILTRSGNRLISGAKHVLACTVVAFRFGPDLFVSRTRGNASFYSWHI